MTGTIAGFTSTGIDDNATSTAITIDASENVGIGVTPETDWDASWDALQLGVGASIVGYTYGSDSAVAISSNAKYTTTSYDNGNQYINTKSASKYIQKNDGQHVFQVAPSGTADSAITWTTAMTIDNSGYITLGTYSIGSNGVQFAFQNGNAGIAMTGSGTSTQNKFDFGNANGWVGSIATSGSSTSYNTSSDYRLKELDVPMEGSIDRLKALRPINFAWKADGSRVDGFFAHEAGEVVPECVHGTKDAMVDEEYEVTPAVMDGETVVTEAVMGTRSVPDYQGIDQSKLVPLLVASLQEAIARIEVLENA
jgi:hypothetical protein